MERKTLFLGVFLVFFGLKLLAFYLIILSVVFAARLTVTDFYTAFAVDFLPFLSSGILASFILMALLEYNLKVLYILSPKIE